MKNSVELEMTDVPTQPSLHPFVLLNKYRKSAEVVAKSWTNKSVQYSVCTLSLLYKIKGFNVGGGLGSGRGSRDFSIPTFQVWG